MSKPLTIQYTGKYANHLLREKDKEIERLNNIIKEAREYIQNDIKGNYFKRYDDEVYEMCEELLEILDKEKDNE